MKGSLVKVADNGLHAIVEKSKAIENQQIFPKTPPFARESVGNSSRYTAAQRVLMSSPHCLSREVAHDCKPAAAGHQAEKKKNDNCSMMIDRVAEDK